MMVPDEVPSIADWPILKVGSVALLLEHLYLTWLMRELQGIFLCHNSPMA